MKQRLGEKKERRCREIGGIEYSACYTRGGWGHFWAECWWPVDENGKSWNADAVNYKIGEVQPKVRDGRLLLVQMGNRQG